MRLSLKRCAESARQRGFYPIPLRLPRRANHIQFNDPISWAYARDVQDSLIKAYQEFHVRPFRPGYALPPTFVTLRFKPVFTYGRDSYSRPSNKDRDLLEGETGEDGLCAYETKMAWSRQNGWRFHSPGQLWCWMVCDMHHWHVLPI
jgi:hypothetical protein